MTTTLKNLSRRHFLRYAGGMTALGSAAPLALNLGLMGHAAAQSANDYKALVCVFLNGGNDAFNTVLATDAASWSAYTSTRQEGSQSVALKYPGTPADPSAPAGTAARWGGALPITPLNAQGRQFALHPALAAARRLFNVDKRMSIIANVGPLMRPTSKADLTNPSHALPPKLRSHNDQQSVWQAMAAEGAASGWGGRMGDLLASSNGQGMFTAVTTAGRSLWASGAAVHPIAVSSAGALSLGTDDDGSLYGSAELGAALKRISASTRGSNRMETDYTQVVQRAVDSEAALRTMLPPASDARWAGTGTAGGGQSLNYISPNTQDSLLNPLAQQLQTVARVIAAANGGGMAVRRQVFFVELKGFDTHDNQTVDHAELLAQLAHGMLYFDSTLGTMGLQDNISLFTASEFGRTFTQNADGTDHGWGGHQFVLGSALAGGDIYGRFPTLGVKNAGNNRFDSSADLLDNGVLLPALAVDQMAASLGRWMGLSNGQLADLLPSFANFGMRYPQPVA